MAYRKTIRRAPRPPRSAPLPFQFDDGGRAAAGFKGTAGDCVCRSIAIATGYPYMKVYEDINELAKLETITKRKRHISSARNGVYKVTVHRLLESYGWVWHPTMRVGQGCTVHLAQGELPDGRLVVRLSKHETCVIDGVVHDIFDPSRGGTRCVYGYWTEG